MFVDRPPGGIDADTVLADGRGGARMAVEHLLAHGHRRIGVVVDHETVHTARERVAGARDALATAGVAMPEELVRGGASSAERAQAAVLTLLELPADRRPTGLFAGNNRITLGALRALRASSSRVALVGFDDFEFADMLDPAITVVRHSPADMGRLAAQAAYRRLDGHEGEPVRQVIPCELVVRGSGEVD